MHPITQTQFGRTLDKAIYFVALFGPIMTIPQVVKIFAEKSAAGVSIISWTGYLFLAMFWLSYGLMHKDKAVIFANFLWIIAYIIVIAGIMLYS